MWSFAILNPFENVEGTLKEEIDRRSKLRGKIWHSIFNWLQQPRNFSAVLVLAYSQRQYRISIG